jgi:hypothetical protein
MVNIYKKMSKTCLVLVDINSPIFTSTLGITEIDYDLLIAYIQNLENKFKDSSCTFSRDVIYISNTDTDTKNIYIEFHFSPECMEKLINIVGEKNILYDIDIDSSFERIDIIN